MINGTVKWFNDAKGFGFIEPEGGGTDIFAHFSCIAMEGFKTLKQGARVTFELTQGPKGHLAQNIRQLPDLDGLPADDDDVPEEPAAREIVKPQAAPKATPKPAAKAPPRRTLRVRAPQYDFSGQES